MLHALLQQASVIQLFKHLHKRTDFIVFKASSFLKIYEFFFFFFFFINMLHFNVSFILRDFRFLVDLQITIKIVFFWIFSLLKKKIFITWNISLSSSASVVKWRLVIWLKDLVQWVKSRKSFEAPINIGQMLLIYC